MTKSPCLTCDFRYENKNSERCVNCEKRVTYAVARGMLPEEVLMEGTREERIMSAGKAKPKKKKTCINGCDRPVKARGMCDNCYTKWKRKNPTKIRPYSKVAASLAAGVVKIYDIRLQANEDSAKNELLRKAAEIASSEYRTIQNQVFFWIKEGIERQKLGVE